MARHSEHECNWANLSQPRALPGRFGGSVALLSWRLLLWHLKAVSGIAFPVTDFPVCPLFLFLFFVFLPSSAARCPVGWLCDPAI